LKSDELRIFALNNIQLVAHGEAKGKYGSVKNLNLKLYNFSKKTGIGGLYIVYSHMGKEKYFLTTISLHQDKWNSTLKEPTHKALTIEETFSIDTLYDRIAKLIRDYQNANDMALPPIIHIDERITKRELPTDIHELYQQYLQNSESKVKGGTLTAYRIVGNLLKEVDKHYMYHLNLHNFNFSFITKFVEYCQNVKDNKNSNTTVKNRIGIYKGFVTYLNDMEVKHTINIEKWNVIESTSTYSDMLCLEEDRRVERNLSLSV
jgi:hypothetical protein